MESYQKLLGDAAWARLHPDIQRRFGCGHSTQSVVYKGVMHKVWSSNVGAVFAQICRVVGSPLVRHCGNNIPIEVDVYPDSSLNGMCWDRLYHFPQYGVQRVKSTKCIQANGHLVELVGRGFGMTLQVTEEEGAICFESTQFFCRLMGRTLHLPDCLSPGCTSVKQRALEGGGFEFSLRVCHPIFGETFYQVGTFKECSKI